MTDMNINPAGNPSVSNLTVTTSNPAGNPVISELSNGTTLPSSAGVQQIQHEDEGLEQLEDFAEQ